MQQQAVITPRTVEQSPDQTFQLERSIGFHKRRARVCGIIHIVLGVVLVSLGITAIIIECVIATIGTAIWCGIFIIIAGSIGCWSARGHSRGVITASMILSIIAAAVCGTVLLVTSLVAISEEIEQSEECGWNSYDYYDDSHSYDDNYNFYWNYTCSTIYYQHYEGRLAVDGLILAIAVVESVIAIIQSIISCKVVCRERRSPNPVCYVVGQNGGIQQNAQMVILPVGQPVTYIPPVVPNQMIGMHAGTMGQPYQPATMGQPYQPATMGQPYQPATMGQPFQTQPQLVFQPMGQSFPQHRAFKSEQPQYQGVV